MWRPVSTIVFGLSVALSGCQTAPTAGQPSSGQPSAGQPSAGSSDPAASASSAQPSAAPNAASTSNPKASAPEKPTIGAAEAARVLFLKKTPAKAAPCLAKGFGPDPDRIRCLLEVLYKSDPLALRAALKLYNTAGVVAGVESAHTMNGGWRGKIEIVPEPVLGRHRRHLVWMAKAYEEYGTFFDKLEKEGAKATGYRYAPIRLRFFRSVGRTTPSAYASGWTVAYNVSGSLHSTADAVRETMFHETFHLNDKAHGNWSRKVLTSHYEDILSRCTKNKKPQTACLRPYAPNDTMVRGGTFYAFQPGNGVWEYSAELAIRYYREHRAILAGKRLSKKAFKCGPSPNAETWQLLTDEFFGGIDLVPACAPK